MANAKDLTLNMKGRKILLFGKSGSGKTSMLATLPGKTFVYMFDPAGLATLAGQDIEYECFFPDTLNLNVTPLSKQKTPDSQFKGTQEPKAYQDFIDDFNDKNETDFFSQFDNVCFDGFTTFQWLVMDRLQHLNGRLGKWPEQADWTATMSKVQDIVRTITANQDVNIVWTGHVESKQEGENGPVTNQPLLIGQLKARIPLMFSDIWLCFTDTVRNQQGMGTRWCIQTIPDRKNDYIRSSVRGLYPEEDVTIEDWTQPQTYGVGKLLTQEPS